VIGSGTTLDTARFRALLGNHLDVDPQHVHGYVVGEHGDSEVLTWSIVDIGGLPLDAFVRLRHLDLGPAVRDMIEGRVREAAYKIIAGKGATYYGVAAALARIVDVILHDHRAILTICTPTAEVAGVRDVTVSLPHLVGRTGVIDTLPLQLDDQETEALRESAQIIRDLLDGQEGEGM
jgi:L-lactate dehydrogenase